MQTFIETNSRYDAMKRISHHVSKLVKVEGGYLGFEFMTDYYTWRKQS